VGTLCGSDFLERVFAEMALLPRNNRCLGTENVMRLFEDKTETTYSLDSNKYFVFVQELAVKGQVIAKFKRYKRYRS